MKKVAVVGFGVIGQSWARLFAKNGLDVTVSDVRDDLDQVISRINADLPQDAQLTTAPLEEAVKDADLVQESGPEREQIKRDLYATMTQAAKDTTIFASSSSGIPSSVVAQDLPADVAARILIAHPFNPPELLPLVEIVPNEHTSEDVLNTVTDFYTQLGKVPVRLNREIPGFVINRLQWAIMKEASYLVKQGIVNPAQLDTAVRNSVGVRWASVGPFEAFHQGSDHGFRGLVEHVLSTFDSFDTEATTFGDDSYTPVVEAVEESYGTTATEESKAARDRRLIAVSDALTKADGNNRLAAVTETQSQEDDGEK